MIGYLHLPLGLAGGMQKLSATLALEMRGKSVCLGSLARASAASTRPQLKSFFRKGIFY
jgi:hypothetical protein